MKRNLIITTLVASMTAVPLLIGCNQEMEDEPLDGLEFETLAEGRKTRAMETPNTPNADYTDKQIEAGCDTITIGNSFPVKVRIVWSEGYIKRSNPGVSNGMSTVTTSEAWPKMPATGNVHVEVANLMWDLYDGHIYGHIQIKGTYDLIGGGGNYNLDFDKPVSFTPKHINIKKDN